MTLHSVGAEDLKRYIEELFGACGVSEDQRSIVASNLVWSELIGRTNYGMARIPVLVKRLEHGLLNPVCQPVLTRSPAVVPGLMPITDLVTLPEI